MKTTTFKTPFRMGTVDDQPIYLSPPSWDCDWYWGFGYLGNKNCHYHIDRLENNANIREALIKHFGDTFTITDDQDQWKFAELMATFYSLKKAAEVLGRGGSHYTSNPVAETIKNQKEVDRLNNEVLPAIFNAIEDIIKKYRYPNR